MTSSDGNQAQIATYVFGIGQFIRERKLAIPDYQRSYSWTSEEVGELWTDLGRELRRGSSEYFLGSVVTTDTGVDRLQIIDGQQRLATVTLLFAAMRDIFQARSDERAGDVERDFLGKKNMATRVMEAKLTLNAEDNHFFQQTIGGRTSYQAAKSATKSHREIRSAYEYLHNELTQLITGLPAESWQGPLVALHDFITNSTKIINVHVPNENRAFVIFETLNDRGLNLSTADLLKGHLFGTAESRIDECKSLWARTMGPFSSNREGTETDVFLRHYWASTQGVARVKALFSAIRDTVNTPEESVALATELASSAPLWVQMFDQDSEYWFGASAGARSNLRILKQLNVEQCRPLILAAMRTMDRRETSALINLVVSWSIRWFVAGGGSAGVTERLYAEAAGAVGSGVLTSASEVAARIGDKVPTDAQFMAAFATLTVRRGWLARYYLQSLEQQAAGAEPELVPNPDADELNLEHILARNAKRGDWLSFSDDEFSDTKLMLGNQVLLRKSQNASLGNGDFASKRAALAASELKLTREAGLVSDWTPAAVRERQERLAVLAVARWPRR